MRGEETKERRCNNEGEEMQQQRRGDRTITKERR